ncbi:MAG: DUF5802 family protein [Halobacteria archaeon]|nr:DUF5802 family protein [Halobacteria archaeon]
MFEDFSSGYYLGRLYVEPHRVEHAVMHDAEYEKVSDRIGSSEDEPLVMKVDRKHLCVQGDDNIPSGTLVIPEGIMNEMPIRNPPELKEVFLAKPEQASKLLDFIGCFGSITETRTEV